MKPFFRWTILIVALLFVMGGGYFALQKSGVEDPFVPQTKIDTPTPTVGKHGQSISSSIGGLSGSVPVRSFDLPGLARK